MVKSLMQGLRDGRAWVVGVFRAALREPGLLVLCVLLPIGVVHASILSQRMETNQEMLRELREDMARLQVQHTTEINGLNEKVSSRLEDIEKRLVTPTAPQVTVVRPSPETLRWLVNVANEFRDRIASLERWRLEQGQQR